MSSVLSLAGGAALGLASSLHCIGMCGGISVLFGYSGGCGTLTAGREQLFLNGGRIASYAILGALAGGIGTAAVGMLGPGDGHELLRWAAALSLGWIGLAMTGLVPSPAFLAHTHIPRPAARLILSLPLPARRIGGGLAWGLLPCGMVYGGLLFAMFAGTALGGAEVMLGFGLGTLPALITANLGFTRARSALRSQGAKKWLGAAITGLALISLVDSPAALQRLCSHFAGSLLS